MDYIWIFLLAFLTSFLLSKLVIFLFPRIGLMDRPQKYGHNRPPIPYPAGAVLYATFVIFLLILSAWDAKTIAFVSAVTLLFVVSFWDDRRGISPLVRLSIQICAALIMVLAGVSVIGVSNPFGTGSLLLEQWNWDIVFPFFSQNISLLSTIITVVWIVLFINTLNWLDEPGIVGGVAGISFFIIFLLSLTLALRTNVGVDEIRNADMIARLAIVGVGMCAAFLLFNFPPAKVLMGDSGSIVLGFILAILAIYSGSKIATTFLVLGFPVLDAVVVIGRRILQGKSPLKGDFSHFHHRLVRIGFSERGMVMTIYLICLIFGMLALFLGTQGKIVAIILMILVSILIEYLVFYQEKRNQKPL